MERATLGVSDHSAHSVSLRAMSVIAAVVFAIGTPTLQALAPFGLSAAEFANDGNETLRAASYAFSIWSVIYLGIIAYAFYQAAPRTPQTQLLQNVGWPSVLAIAGCGAWILASAFDQKLLTVAIISLSAVIMTSALVRSDHQASTGRERWFVVWPLSLLAGWLTIATAINALTVMTATDVITPNSAPVAAGVGIAAVLLVALGIVLRGRLPVYGIPIAWGLAAVFVAEQDHRPVVALGAAGAALLVAVAVLFVAVKKRETPSRA